MPLFTRHKEKEVQGFLLRVANNNCPELKARLDGPRLDRRVNLTLVVLVVPIERNRAVVSKAFTAVTKEFSSAGVAIVLAGPQPLDDLLVAFRAEGELVFIRGKVKHINPMGGGFFQMGVKLQEMVDPNDHPELKVLLF